MTFLPNLSGVYSGGYRPRFGSGTSLFKSKGIKQMTTSGPVDPGKRIEIIDILRGFALLGILLNNMLYFSGYSFLPFATMKQWPHFQLNEALYSLLDIIITAKFYHTFFAVKLLAVHAQQVISTPPSVLQRRFLENVTILGHVLNFVRHSNDGE